MLVSVAWVRNSVVLLLWENGWGIVLDDNVATTKLQDQMPHIQMLTTFDLVKYWACHENVCEPILKEVLKDICIRGNHVVGKDHPHFAWVSYHSG